MKRHLGRASIRVFEPSELAAEERERLLAALEAFVNLGHTPQDFERFMRQNPDLFRDTRFETSRQALPWFTAELKRMEGVEGIGYMSHRMAIVYRDELRGAWDRSPSQPQKIGAGAVASIAFLGLLGLGPVGGVDAWLQSIKVYLPRVPEKERDDFLNKAFGARFAQLWLDWRTGNFEYTPHNDFQKAVYVLFREGWRAKVCALCARRFIADKPVQRYCSTKCIGKAKRERNLEWWNKHGKRWRVKRKLSKRRSLKRGK